MTRVDLAWAERRLEEVTKRLMSLRGKIHTPHELVARYLAGRGYSSVEIEQLAGIPRPKVFVYAKTLGFKVSASKGMTFCRQCDKAFSGSYHYCPFCGRDIMPLSMRVKRTAKGEPWE